MAITYPPNRPANAAPVVPAQPAPAQPQMPAQQAAPATTAAPMVPDIDTMTKVELKHNRELWSTYVNNNDYSIIEGALMFANYISQPMTAEEFAEENKRNESIGRNPFTAPGFRVQLDDARVIPGPNGYTPADYVQMSRMFKRKVSEYNPDPKPCYELFTTSSRNPWIAIAADDTCSEFTQIFPSKQPVAGTRVRIVVSLYQSRQQTGQLNRSLNGVMILDTDLDKVFSDNTAPIMRDRQRLYAERGIVINPSTAPDAEPEQPVLYPADSPEAAAVAANTMPVMVPGVATPQMPPIPPTPSYAAPAEQPVAPWTPTAPGGIVTQ